MDKQMDKNSIIGEISKIYRIIRYFTFQMQTLNLSYLYKLYLFSFIGQTNLSQKKLFGVAIFSFLALDILTSCIHVGQV